MVLMSLRGRESLAMHQEERSWPAKSRASIGQLQFDVQAMHQED
jgi:hypothetical protein